MPVLGQGLELDRRLPLVGDPVTDPEERADGIEEPPHARGGYASDVAFHLTAHHTELHLVTRRRCGKCPIEPDSEGRQVRHGDAAWIAHRRVTAGQWQGPEVADAFEPGVVGHQYLSAPDLGRPSTPMP